MKFPADRLQRIQEHFHALIRDRAGDLVVENHLVLPELAALLAMKQSNAWFPVPGMYGGFSYWFDDAARQPKLITESWCRVVEGSGQRHEITADRIRLVDEGFV